MGKIISLIITVITAVIGIILIFITNIDMERYATFTKAFAPFALTLMVSIGANSAVDKISGKGSSKEKEKLDK